MAERAYSKRELDQILTRFDERQQERHEEQNKILERIEQQTTKTNGRVGKVEEKQAINDTADQVFRARIYTAVSMLTFMIAAILVPIVSAFISSH